MSRRSGTASCAGLAVVAVTGCGAARLTTSTGTGPAVPSDHRVPQAATTAPPAETSTTTPDTSGINQQISGINSQLSTINGQLNAAGAGLSASEGDPSQ